MSGLLVGVALISIALGAVSGFALLVAVDHPDRLRRVGIVDPVRVRQVHLDWIIMGTVMAVIGLAVPGLSWWATVLVLFGGIVNPLSFVPMAFSKTVATTRWFQTVSFVSFTALSVGAVLAVVEYFLR